MRKNSRISNIFRIRKCEFSVDGSVCSELCRKLGNQEHEMKRLHDQLLEAAGKLDQLEMEKSSVDMELRRMEVQHSDKERDCQTLVKDFEYAKERETVLMVDRSVNSMQQLYNIRSHFQGRIKTSITN